MSGRRYPYFSPSQFDAIELDPMAMVPVLYNNHWERFANDLGAADASMSLSNELLAGAFAAHLACMLKPYWREGDPPLCETADLPTLLKATSLECGTLVALSWHFCDALKDIMPNVDIVAIGWDAAYPDEHPGIGNHVQIMFMQGRDGILYDPTHGIAVRGDRYGEYLYDTIARGSPIDMDRSAHSFYRDYMEEMAPQLKETHDLVWRSFAEGLLRPSNILYYENRRGHYLAGVSSGIMQTPAARERQQQIV